MSIAGKWGESVITVKDKQVTITMGSRPNGNGIYISENPEVVYINFPDDRAYIGTLINEHQIQWCGIGSFKDNNVWNR